ncbi:MAG: T9SS type A sorting domain-containing protein [Bacteroidetes bacterium]|nr:T9SS type A sorting domain-containing protein [Bacteroidota bacterium]
MKIISISVTVFVLICWNHTIQAQTIFKDLNPGTGHADPIQFVNVKDTMYFITYSRSPTYIYQLWKSDGSAENTVLIKDNIITGAIANMVLLRASMNGTVYYSVNKSGATAGDTTRLWKTDGSTPVLVATLPHPGYPGIGGGYPTGFTIAGNKLFFNMWKDNGRELWVSDGTAAGTFEVIDLLPGANGGAALAPMVAYNGKVFFQGSNTLGIWELFSSDGTAGGTTLVKAGVYKPENFIVYKNELYFGAGNSADELWKTDGTALGTVKIATCPFGKSNVYIFNNQIFFTASNNLWKSDGTTLGTVLVKNAVGQITGANNNYFFTSKIKSIPVPPYIGYDYWKSDGTTDGTIQVSSNLGSGNSFVVLNNKMYNTSGATGIWETDGTEAGTTNIITGYTGIPFVFKNTVFFSKTEQTTGIELWYFTPGLTSVDERNFNQLPSAYTLYQNYPNPFNPSTNIEFTLPFSSFVTLNVYDALGREVALLVKNAMNVGTYTASFNGNGLAGGIYFYRLQAGYYSEVKKMMLVK